MRPESGEIQIEGKRWRWLTVGHVGGPFRRPGAEERGRPPIAWSLRFRSLDDPDRAFWCDLPADGPGQELDPPGHGLSDEALRAAFRRGRRSERR